MPAVSASQGCVRDGVAEPDGTGDQPRDRRSFEP
jgi:hypothetical protein